MATDSGDGLMRADASSPGEDSGAAPRRHVPAGSRRTTRTRPTVEDVAAAAGVSRGTVSRVLNGGHYVSPAALAAVNRAMRATGYVVNRNARSLVTKESGCVAFVLAESAQKLFDDPNFPVLLHAATRALARHDIVLTLMIMGSPDERARTLRYLRSDHVDGALLISTHSGDSVIPELERAQVPIVACGKPLGFEHAVPYVAADDRAGARDMTQYLAGLGRSRVATITGPLDTPGGRERLDGYYEGLGREARPGLVAVGDYGYASGERAMSELLARDPDLDAVFAASDVMARGALAELRRRGISVPDTVAVGGFDDSSAARTADPPLTTMRQPLPEIADAMVDVLLSMIRDDARPEPVVFPTELVRRASA